jgi:thiamine-monophosphate kinase
VVSSAAKEMSEMDGRSPLDHALSDGEDFELLLAVAGDAPVPPTLQDAYLYPVGVIAEEGLFLQRRDGTREPIEARGFEHLT